ncbi:MAG: type II toxin-antitoxin system YafQ family toxin [Clostridiales Family XIII bacterium]|jgi:mRNA interferase YafQ|nr:type II toxin-antitoxin system YafQ family toxin [Clostridiales Family XIII bacterium]
MLEIAYTPAFKSDYKQLKKKHFDMIGMNEAIRTLAIQDKGSLARKYKDHALKGNWKGYREIHVEKDLLIIYRIDNQNIVLTLVRTGKHDDLL